MVYVGERIDMTNKLRIAHVPMFTIPPNYISPRVSSFTLIRAPLYGEFCMSIHRWNPDVPLNDGLVKTIQWRGHDLPLKGGFFMFHSAVSS